MSGYEQPGNESTHAVGVVLIGRNEGRRLERCIQSIDLGKTAAVYVDSGSTDHSVAFCRAAGVTVVELDTHIPFTAARARNAGLQALLLRYPHIDFVQFVDGDCQLQPHWIATAQDFLAGNPHCAAVCGRRREIDPARSVYNRLCDIEWDTPVGEARSFGGDVMLRAQALAAVGGYRDDLIAGEEPELAFRLRGAGWKIHRIDAEMTLHDAGMTRFSQWWRRAQRAGYARANGVLLHGNSAERYYVKPLLSTLTWGAALPFAIALSSLWSPLAALLLLAYPVQYLRMASSSNNRAGAPYSRPLFLLLGKFPEALGSLQFIYERAIDKRPQIIEYK